MTAQESNSQLFLDFLEKSQQLDFKNMEVGVQPDCEVFSRCYDLLCKLLILDTKISKTFKTELCRGRQQIFEKQ